MMEGAKSGSASGWICNRCRIPLEVQTVRLQYLKTIFALNLPECPRCGMILVDEELATGKMAEAEQALEDK
jgi:predicted  nucleic acid-binding Zn-ribbon protein